LDSNEFVLSKLETAVARARSIELISFTATVTLSYASLSVALATVTPVSNLGLIRDLLLGSSVVAVVFLYLFLGRLLRNRRRRLDMLRRWQMEAFLKRKRLDSLPEEKVKRMVELIHLMEDSDITGSPRFGHFEEEFSKILNG
jgi:hypothetical protein